jgi:TetR/AcrR family transcriptional repressor of mexJK operon
MPAPEELSREKHEKILEAAGRLFAALGFEGASMSAITREAGVSKGTIYHHFGSKAGLFGAYVRGECRRNLQPLFDAIVDERDERATLLDFGSRLLTLMVSPTGMAIDRVVMSEAERFPELAEVFYAAGPAMAIETIARWLQVRTKSGAISVEDPVFAAEQFLALCQTQVVTRRRLRLIEELPKLTIDRIVTGAVDTFLKAYGRR